MWQCATMQSPSGGEKDILAPKIISTNPGQAATNAIPSSIEIQFDEYIKLNNLQSQLLISPPLEMPVLISQKGKNLFIKLQESLTENSTYTFNFGKGISDYHEGNILKDYSLVFSTGDQLDSLSIKGKINNCMSESLPKDLIVGIYQKDTLIRDSTIYLQKPAYFGLINEIGEYKIENIRKGTYELIAFEDGNANYIYDGSTEQIAFNDSLINMKDSTLVNLWLFKELQELKLLDVLAKKNGRIHWTYNQDIDSAKINSDTQNEFYSKLKEDSLLVWPINYTSDSFYIWTEIGSHLDTLLIMKDTLKSQHINLSLEHAFLKNNSNLVLHSDAPILGIDTAKIELLTDSIRVDYSVEYSDFELQFKFPHKQSKDYNLSLKKGAIISTYKNVNNPIDFEFYTKLESELAGLSININPIYTNFFIELIKDDKVLARCRSAEELSFSNLLPTKYQLRLVLDTNQDGKWSTGNYIENRQSEKVFYYPDEINLRANWVLEIDFNLAD